MLVDLARNLGERISEDMNLENTKEAIKRTDKAYLERRAERFGELKGMRDFSEIQEPVKGLLLDAYFSYAYLYYAGSVLLSTTALELTLKIVLSQQDEKYKKYKFIRLINSAKEYDLFDDKQVEIAHEIRNLRNIYVHYNPDEIREISEKLKLITLIQEGEEMPEVYSKELIEQLQLEEATPQIAFKCLSKCYELILSLYKNCEDSV